MIEDPKGVQHALPLPLVLLQGGTHAVSSYRSSHAAIH